MRLSRNEHQTPKTELMPTMPHILIHRTTFTGCTTFAARTKASTGNGNRRYSFPGVKIYRIPNHHLSARLNLIGHLFSFHVLHNQKSETLRKWNRRGPFLFKVVTSKYVLPTYQSKKSVFSVDFASIIHLKHFKA